MGVVTFFKNDYDTLGQRRENDPPRGGLKGEWVGGGSLAPTTLNKEQLTTTVRYPMYFVRKYEVGRRRFEYSDGPVPRDRLLPTWEEYRNNDRPYIPPLGKLSGPCKSFTLAKMGCCKPTWPFFF